MSAAATLPAKVVTRALRGVERREPGAVEELWRLVYAWVVQRACVLLHAESRRHELGEPEDLAHEAFLKLKPAHLASCRDRWHLIRIATRAMRQALVDRARQREARGVMDSLEELPPQPLPGVAADVDRSLDVALALDALQAVNDKVAEVATLHLVGGFNFVEIGRLLGKSESWARAVWGQAGAWLGVRLG